jgi:hypothetical protein
MNRRGFLGALAALVAAGKGAPALFARLRSPAAAPIGLMELTAAPSLAGLSGDRYTTWTDYNDAVVAQMRWQTEQASRHMARSLEAQFYGTSTGVLPRAYRGVRLVRRDSGYGAWERRVLG